MTCECRQNYDETKITQPCPQHLAYAREYAVTVFAARVEQAEAMARGGRLAAEKDAERARGAGPRANLKAPWEEPQELR